MSDIDIAVCLNPNVDIAKERRELIGDLMPALKTDTTDKEPEGCTRYALPACTYAFFEQSPGYLCELADVMAAKIAEAGFAVAENAICFETDNKERDGTVNVWVPVVTL